MKQINSLWLRWCMRQGHGKLSMEGALGQRVDTGIKAHSRHSHAKCFSFQEWASMKRVSSARTQRKTTARHFLNPCLHNGGGGGGGALWEASPLLL